MNLEALKALLEAATPGPWFATIGDFARDEEDREFQESLDTWTVGPNSEEENWSTDANIGGYGLNKADALLIIAMRNSFKEMLAVVEASKGVKHREDIGGYGHEGYDELFKALTALAEKLGAMK